MDDKQLKMATGEAFESSQYTEIYPLARMGGLSVFCMKASQHAPWRCALIMSIFYGHSFFTLHLLIVCIGHMCMCVGCGVCVLCTWRSEDNLRESVLSHHAWGSRD